MLTVPPAISWPNALSEPDVAELRAIVDATPSRVSLVTPSHNYLYANREFLGFVGLSLSELVGRSARDVLGDEVYAAFSKTASAVTASKESTWEGWVAFAGGHEHYLQVKMAPYAPGGDEVVAIFVFTRDLTDLKLHERDLARTVKQLSDTMSLHQAMITSSLDCIFLMDESGVVLEFNPSSETTFGFTRAEAIGQSIIDLIVPYDVRGSAATKTDLFRALMARDTLGQAIRRHTVTKDGRTLLIELTLMKVILGERELFMAHGRDITPDVQRRRDLAKSEAALAVSEQVSTQVIHSALDGFVLADSNGIVRDFNPAAETMFGHTRADVIGKPLSELIIPEHHRAAHDAGMARYMATGVSTVMGKRLQLDALTADGELIPVEVTINEVKLPDQHLFTAHLRDLRESRKAQAEIERQRERIHQVEKLSAMGSLLAGVAHELNNPLAILVAQSTLLKDKAPTNDVRQRADRIYAASERAGRIIKSFLAMARQNAPERAPINLNLLMADTLEMLAYGLRSAGIEVARELQADLPMVSADGDMMRQVLANVVINAQQALASAAQPRRLAVRSCVVPDYVVIEIEDNGPGVPAEAAARIFDPFFTTKPAGVGTGIGLAICKDIVLAHNGKLELVNSAGNGAMFRITLPVAKDHAVIVDEEQGPDESDRILIIDDERDVGESLAEILEMMGQRVVVVESAEAALELVARERFDRVFVDLRMPEMNGQTFIEKLDAINHRLAARTVLMTGDTVRGPLVAAGGRAAAFLEKPFTVSDVRKMLAAEAEK